MKRRDSVDIEIDYVSIPDVIIRLKDALDTYGPKAEVQLREDSCSTYAQIVFEREETKQEASIRVAIEEAEFLTRKRYYEELKKEFEK